MKKIFSFNFNCVIAVFSIVCILINCFQLSYLESDKKVRQIGEYVNSAELNSMTQDEVNLGWSDIERS